MPIFPVPHLPKASVRKLLPALRKWHAGASTDEFHTIVSATRVYRPNYHFNTDNGLALHTVTSCELSRRELSCDATVVLGAPGRVFYVSPKSGRAVSRDAGEEWRHRLLALPAFLAQDNHSAPSAADLAKGFQLTGFFLARDVLEPRNLTFSDARAHFIAAVERALPNAA